MSTATRALVLVNLGSPASPTPRDIRRFLRLFLSDARVVEIPRILWLPILYGLILPFRPYKTSRNYKAIWQDGMPLLSIVRQQRDALQAHCGDEIRVSYALTYGEPSLRSVLSECARDNISHITVLPLYPQFSATTTGAVYDQWARIVLRQRTIQDCRVVNNYHQHPLYIDALTKSIQRFWCDNARADRLLISFHGIPQRNIDRGDPYQGQCVRTAELLAQKLQLPADQWMVSFQSRFGPAKWLQPYTNDVLTDWGQQNFSVDVVCPGFSADCLETLEEIALQGRTIFINAGGSEFRYIPALNAHPDHIAMMASWVIANRPTGA